ncbi:MAG: hypothetical protein ACK55Z_08465 [bacterium]
MEVTLFKPTFCIVTATGISTPRRYLYGVALGTTMFTMARSFWYAITKPLL